MTHSRKADWKSWMCTKVCSYGFNYTVYTLPQPFFNFINAIIMNYYLSQWFLVQSLLTTTAILFCDITKLEETTLPGYRPFLTIFKNAWTLQYLIKHFIRTAVNCNFRLWMLMCVGYPIHSCIHFMRWEDVIANITLGYDLGESGAENCRHVLQDFKTSLQFSTIACEASKCVIGNIKCSYCEYCRSHNTSLWNM